MAYTPHTWQCGELVTDDDMNRIEEGIQEALDCCNNGYSCEDSYVPIYNGVVRTVKHTQQSGQPISGGFSGVDLSLFGDVIRVTYDGTEYICPLVSTEYNQYYGATIANPFSESDFSQYPFNIYLYLQGVIVSTQTEGNHIIKVEGIGASPTTSECFDSAVGSASRFVVAFYDNNGVYSVDKRYSEILNAIINNRDVVVKQTNEYGTTVYRLVRYDTNECAFSSVSNSSNELSAFTITIRRGTNRDEVYFSVITLTA